MDFIHFICWEDELKWLGRVPRLDFVMSEEELLLGQVSLALSGLSNASYVVSLRTGRSSYGPEFGKAHYFWAGPHNVFLPDKKKIKEREKCNIHNIFHNTFTTNVK